MRRDKFFREPQVTACSRVFLAEPDTPSIANIIETFGTNGWHQSALHTWLNPMPGRRSKDG